MPEIVTAVEAPTACVATANVALVAPAGTVTLPGTVATPGLALPSVTAAPPEGAAALSVTVPCVAVPPVTVAGLIDNDDKEAAVVAP